MRIRNIALIALGSAVIIAAFLLADRPTAPSNERHVAATLFPLYDILNNIAPDEVTVTQILPAGANPHTFEPSPALIEQLQGVDEVFAIGYGIDDWSGSVLPIQAQTVANNIALRESAEPEAGHEDEEEHGPIDPHYWLTIPNAKHIAENVAARLIQLYPEKQTEIETKLAAYLKQLDDADGDIRAALANMQNRNVVTMHDAWYYFAEEYGITIAGTFEPFAGQEPTPQYLDDLQTTIRQANVHTIYIETGSAVSALMSFAQNNNLAILELDAEE